MFAQMSEIDLLFRDLETVKQVNFEINDTLPFMYNSTLSGGYLNMPSARMNTEGMVAIGGVRLPPYNIWSVNLQPFKRLEISTNYRVYTGVLEWNMGKMGFGDDADRGINFKLKLLDKDDGFPYLPEISVGGEDFYGSKRFESYYFVATKQWLKWHLETTIGWAQKRVKGWFGAIAWSPWRFSKPPFNGFTFLAEYDATDYKCHAAEHPKGREVASRVNVGVAWTFFDLLQLKAATQRGKEFSGQVTINYNLGQTKGLFPKVDDAPYYKAPIDIEPLGALRTERLLAQQLAYAFQDQGLTLYKAVLRQNRENLFLKVLNISYRTEPVVRERLEDLLAHLIPSNIGSVTVIVETNGVPVNEYFFRTSELNRFRQGKIGAPELLVLSPLSDSAREPGPYEGVTLFRRKKDAWVWTFGPRLLTFFGSSTGKVKYSAGITTGVQGYIGDQVYYGIEGTYQVKASIHDMGDRDRYNPSQIINVRSDSIRYLQSNLFMLNNAYAQKGWNLGKGWFFRLAGGYFEMAYGGIATEALYAPVGKDWAIGFEVASVLKRRYRGIGFTTQIRKWKGTTAVYERFIGLQYFMDLYYNFKPLNLDFWLSAGQFLARDFGARFQVSRYFPSGMRLFFWYSMTSKHDYVNQHRYTDRGIGIEFPLDIFLKKSSRTMLGYQMAFWLRDVGQRSGTGNQLYPTVHNERISNYSLLY